METLPMPLDALSKGPGGLDDFRISAPPEVHAYLKKLCNGNALLNLVNAEGNSYTTTVWAVDASRDMVCFSADASDPELQRVLNGRDVVAVGYLDNIKVQFDVVGASMARSGKLSALNARIPRELFRFQRRDSYRVRPLPRCAPAAHFAHPDERDMMLELRVYDLSTGGCALILPDGVPPLAPGSIIENVQVDLDGSNTIHCTLLMHHVSSLNEEHAGLCIGCEMLDLSSDSIRLLQRFIDQSQQRRRSPLNA